MFSSLLDVLALKNAKNLVFQLNKKGFNDASIVGRSKNRKLFRVACSKYLTEKEANKNLKNLKKEFQGAWFLIISKLNLNLQFFYCI